MKETQLLLDEFEKKLESYELGEKKKKEIADNKKERWLEDFKKAFGDHIIPIFENIAEKLRQKGHYFEFECINYHEIDENITEPGFGVKAYFCPKSFDPEELELYEMPQITFSTPLGGDAVEIESSCEIDRSNPFSPFDGIYNYRLNFAQINDDAVIKVINSFLEKVMDKGFDYLKQAKYRQYN